MHIHILYQVVLSLQLIQLAWCLFLKLRACFLIPAVFARCCLLSLCAAHQACAICSGGRHISHLLNPPHSHCPLRLCSGTPVLRVPPVAEPRLPFHHLGVSVGVGVGEYVNGIERETGEKRREEKRKEEEGGNETTRQRDREGKHTGE